MLCFIGHMTLQITLAVQTVLWQEQSQPQEPKAASLKSGF